MKVLFICAPMVERPGETIAERAEYQLSFMKFGSGQHVGLSRG